VHCATGKIPETSQPRNRRTLPTMETGDPSRKRNLRIFPYDEPTGAPHSARISRDVGYHSGRTLGSDRAPKLKAQGLGDATSLEWEDLNGEGRRRSAGSGAAKHACCDSIRNQLPVDVSDGEDEAGVGTENRRNSNRGDGTKALPIGAGWLAQCRRSIRRSHSTHNARMSAMSAAANGQQLLRCSERGHRRRGQQ
jgi:hypothetical protein